MRSSTVCCRRARRRRSPEHRDMPPGWRLKRIRRCSPVRPRLPIRMRITGRAARLGSASQSPADPAHGLHRCRDNGQQMAVSTRRDAPRRGRRFRTGACRPRAASDTWARAGRGVGVRAYAAGAWLRRIAAGPVPPYAAGGYAGGVETHGLVQPLAAGGDDREARQRAGPVSVACAALHHAIRASAVQRRALVFHHARYSFGHRSAATG